MVTGSSGGAQVVASWVFWPGDLDPPVPSDRSPEAPGTHPPAQDVVADVIAWLAAPHRVADRHADPLEPRPAARIRQAVGHVAHVVRPVLDATVALPSRLVTAHLHPGEVVLPLVQEELDD